MHFKLLNLLWNFDSEIHAFYSVTLSQGPLLPDQLKFLQLLIHLRKGWFQSHLSANASSCRIFINCPWERHWTLSSCKFHAYKDLFLFPNFYRMWDGIKSILFDFPNQCAIMISKGKTNHLSYLSLWIHTHFPYPCIHWRAFRLFAYLGYGIFGIFASLLWQMKWSVGLSILSIETTKQGNLMKRKQWTIEGQTQAEKERLGNLPGLI